ncbi:hypothetical protein R77555_04381 [Ralstonia mannitolilytica]|nr:hypothetical protein R77555_04381 [Ralstonia mannitolilytica]
MKTYLRLCASRTLRIVVEDHQAVAGLRGLAVAGLGCIALLVLEPVGQALFRQKAFHKREVGFAVLAADGALTHWLAHRQAIVRQRVICEDLFDDFQRGLVFVDIAIHAGAQSVEPRTHGEPIACETAVAAERGATHHITMPCTPVAIGQHETQRYFLGCQLGGVDVGGWAQAIDVQHERRGHCLFGREALDHQVVRGQCRLDGDLAGVLAEQAR